MTEGAVAVYVALATALAVWATIAIYLGRVGAQLRALQRDLERMPPPEPPAAPPMPGGGTTPELRRTEAEQQPKLQQVQSGSMVSALDACQRGNDTVARREDGLHTYVHDHHARALRDPLHIVAWMLALECGCGAAEWLLNTPEDRRFA
ncbi:MAG: hypothetical protein HC828_05410 [Blastochloris sp.]|nr:hypothetical protein [Blastochloris sp.]